MDAASTNQEIANATLALAIVAGLAFAASAVIAWFTLMAAHATRDEAEATRQEAAASLQVVTEMRADRELQWVPILARLLTGNLSYNVANLGGGPAVQVVFVIVEGSDWFKSRTFNLASNERRDVTLIRQAGPPPPRGPIFASLTGKDQGEALLCIDRFGTYHRFLPHLPQTQPEQWRPPAPNRPEWVVWVDTQL